ncbi:hypothetical protein APS14_03970 [Pseudomonas thivervalensis]|nr:hypothetical protein APS14_03970 [Pseudomonas thivervalensis]
MITPSRRTDLSQKLTAFGEVIDLVKPEVAIPALKPNEAMIDLALKQASSIAVLAMFEPAITSMMPPSGSTQPAVDSFAAPAGVTKGIDALQGKEDEFATDCSRVFARAGYRTLISVGTCTDGEERLLSIHEMAFCPLT